MSLVGIADFWCWLHLHCLRVPRDLRRRTVLRQASVVHRSRCRNRTWWCLVCDGRQAHIGTRRGWSTHALHMETCVHTQAVGGRDVLFKCSWTLKERNHALPPVAKPFEQARLSRMNEELVCQGTRSSRTGVGTLQFPLNSFDSVFRQPQNCKRVCCELKGNTI